MLKHQVSSLRIRVLAPVLGAVLGVAMPCRAEIKETPVAPARIVWMSDTTGTAIINPKILLETFPGQVSVNNAQSAMRLSSTPGKRASILLDFGKEMYGGVKLYTGMPASQKGQKVRVCFGESVTEAMSSTDIPNNPDNPTNEHSMRDYEVTLPWLGSIEVGNTGFRFVRIDALDTKEPVVLRYVEARSKLRDDADLGSFESSDPRLNAIWNTGAYTVKLNMQDYVWDGIKRDRLVWLGDMHPEVMTIANVWGALPVVHKSLDFAVTDTPLPGWMNGMCSYSIWWLIIQRDLYMFEGNREYLASQLPYIKGLVKQIDSNVGADGREALTGGTRFLDWPTSESPEIIASGLQSLTSMAMHAAADIAKFMNDSELSAMAAATLARMDKVKVNTHGNKQAAAMAVVAGCSSNPAKDAAIILDKGPDGFSTFYGYYMLDALAATGHKDKAMEIMKDYWGAMLDLGATTFWEDLKYSDTANAARIDEFVPEGKYDIHAGGGAYCYKGLRLSLCHGWASGPTSWLTRYILGVRPTAPGCAEIEVDPYLGNLAYVRGTFPTPKGVVTIDVTRAANGKPLCNVTAPAGIKVVNKAPGQVLTYNN